MNGSNGLVVHDNTITLESGKRSEAKGYGNLRRIEGENLVAGTRYLTFLHRHTGSCYWVRGVPAPRDGVNSEAWNCQWRYMCCKLGMSELEK